MDLRSPATLFAFAALAACVDRIPLEGAGCPCAPGWSCCEASDTCVLEPGLCPDQAFDAGERPDAGEASDAAGLPDASHPSDAADAGAPPDGGDHSDAGAPEDAGTADDAGDPEDAGACGEECGPGESCWLGGCRCDGPHCLRLTGIDPERPLQVDRVVTLRGANLVAGGTFSATFASKQFGWSATAQVAGQVNDTEASVRIPYGPLPASGAEVRLKVSNGTSSDWLQLWLHPKDSFYSDRGVVLLEWIEAQPNPPVAGSPFRLRVRLRSALPASATVTLVPHLEPLTAPGRTTAWQTDLRLEDEAGEAVSSLALAVDEVREVTLVADLPAAAAGAGFTVWVQAVPEDGWPAASTGLLPFTEAVPFVQPPASAAWLILWTPEAGPVDLGPAGDRLVLPSATDFSLNAVEFDGTPTVPGNYCTELEFVGRDGQPATGWTAPLFREECMTWRGINSGVLTGHFSLLPEDEGVDPAILVLRIRRETPAEARELRLLVAAPP